MYLHVLYILNDLKKKKEENNSTFYHSDQNGLRMFLAQYLNFAIKSCY